VTGLRFIVLGHGTMSALCSTYPHAFAKPSVSITTCYYYDESHITCKMLKPALSLQVHDKHIGTAGMLQETSRGCKITLFSFLSILVHIVTSTSDYLASPVIQSCSCSLNA
jgi:hypothetical protein